MSGRTFSRRTACDRLHQRLVRRELGAVGQADRNQVVERPGGVDQGDLEVIVLERHDHRAGSSRRTWVRSALWTRHVSRADVACCSRSATKFLARSTSTLGTSSLLKLRDPLDQVVAALDGVKSAGIHSPILMHLEIGIGRHEQRVVLGGLDVPVAGKLRICRATRGWKMISVVATFWIRPPPP